MSTGPGMGGGKELSLCPRGFMKKQSESIKEGNMPIANEKY
jgi:hypothetical protein